MGHVLQAASLADNTCTCFLSPACSQAPPSRLFASQCSAGDASAAQHSAPKTLPTYCCVLHVPGARPFSYQSDSFLVHGDGEEEDEGTGGGDEEVEGAEPEGSSGPGGRHDAATPVKQQQQRRGSTTPGRGAELRSPPVAARLSSNNFDNFREWLVGGCPARHPPATQLGPAQPQWAPPYHSARARLCTQEAQPPAATAAIVSRQAHCRHCRRRPLMRVKKIQGVAPRPCICTSHLPALGAVSRLPRPMWLWAVLYCLVPQVYLALEYTGLRATDDDADEVERTNLLHAAVRRRFEGAIGQAM